MRRSVGAVAEDMERCRELGVDYLIVHVGRAGESGVDEALTRVASSINRVFDRAGGKVMLLLENTAGMGSEVGYRLEQIASVIERVELNERVGVVIDTAHLFAAGYELRTRQGLDDTLRSFDRLVGLGRLHLVHLNDSKSEMGSRVDRHWHIGMGEIGVLGFKEIVNHPLLHHLPGIMETPRHSVEDDLANLRMLKRLEN